MSNPASPDPADSAQDASTEFQPDAALKNVGGSEELLAELIETFFDDYPKQLQQIVQSKEVGNHDELRRAAHTLKSSLSLLGDPHGSDIALRMEMMGRNAELDQYDTVWTALSSRLQEFDTFLRQLLPTLANG